MEQVSQCHIRETFEKSIILSNNLHFQLEKIKNKWVYTFLRTVELQSQYWKMFNTDSDNKRIKCFIFSLMYCTLMFLFNKSVLLKLAILAKEQSLRFKLCQFTIDWCRSGCKKVRGSLSSGWFWSVHTSVYCGLNYCGVVRVPEKHFGYAQKEPHLKGSASSKKWSISEILFNVWIDGRVKPRPTGDSTINEWPRFIRPRLSLSLSLSDATHLLIRGAQL